MHVVVISFLKKNGLAVIDILASLQWNAASLIIFDIFKDHEALMFAFDPLAIMPNLNHSSIYKCL